jgi:DNA-binding transcriptional regulator YdaS (Cro superfamily)
MNAVAKAVSMFPSRAALARKLGVSSEALRKWELGKIPVERAIEIQIVTAGAVTVSELRPDLPGGIFCRPPDTSPKQQQDAPTVQSPVPGAQSRDGDQAPAGEERREAA